jgi:hypothetical protein
MSTKRTPAVATPRVASNASNVMRDTQATTPQRSVAGDALRDARTPPGVTSPRVASEASQVLRDPKATTAEKSAAGEALRNASTKNPVPKR